MIKPLFAVWIRCDEAWTTAKMHIQYCQTLTKAISKAKISVRQPLNNTIRVYSLMHVIIKLSSKVHLFFSIIVAELIASRTSVYASIITDTFVLFWGQVAAFLSLHAVRNDVKCD